MKKILIVDDDPAGARLLATLLELEGHQPLPAENWQDPIQDLTASQPDLIIMDVRLRSKTGFDLLGEIRAHPDPELASTPVLMMSAEDFRIQSKRADADGFISKPFDLAALRKAIQEIEEGGN